MKKKDNDFLKDLDKALKKTFPDDDICPRCRERRCSKCGRPYQEWYEWGPNYPYKPIWWGIQDKITVTF